jgi:hypothetical protein
MSSFSLSLPPGGGRRKEEGGRRKEGGLPALPPPPRPRAGAVLLYEDPLAVYSIAVHATSTLVQYLLQYQTEYA